MSPGRWDPVMLPTWISELAYGQAMAIRMDSGIRASLRSGNIQQKRLSQVQDSPPVRSGTLYAVPRTAVRARSDMVRDMLMGEKGEETAFIETSLSEVGGFVNGKGSPLEHWSQVKGLVHLSRMVLDGVYA